MPQAALTASAAHTSVASLLAGPRSSSADHFVSHVVHRVLSLSHLVFHVAVVPPVATNLPEHAAFGT